MINFFSFYSVFHSRTDNNFRFSWYSRSNSISTVTSIPLIKTTKSNRTQHDCITKQIYFEFGCLVLSICFFFRVPRFQFSVAFSSLKTFVFTFRCRVFNQRVARYMKRNYVAWQERDNEHQKEWSTKLDFYQISNENCVFEIHQKRHDATEFNNNNVIMATSDRIEKEDGALLGKCTSKQLSQTFLSINA